MAAGKFVDLKRTKADKKSREESYKVSSPDGEDYPYGLRIRLGKDELDKLGLKSLPKTGKKMHLEAKVRVCSTSDNESDGRHEQSMELQIQQMWIGTEADDAKEDKEETIARGMRGALDKALSSKK